MLSLIAIVLPVFGLIGLGFITRASGYIGDRTGEGLSDYVFAIAIPALIFKTLTGVALPAVQPWGYWIAYFAGAFIVWAIAMIVGQRVFKLDHTASVVAGFSAGQANTVMMGIPMILAAFGEEGAVPLFMLIAIHLPIMVSVATLLMEGRDAHLLVVLKKLTHNPILVAIVLGALAKIFNFTPPNFIKVFIDMLAQSAIPCALFSMGIALRRYGLEKGVALPAFLAVLKLGAHPLIVFILARHVFTMPPAWSGVAVLFASCPCGVNAYLFAERYRAGVGVASSSIALSTAMAVVTTVGWLWALGVHIQ
ncbi:AEC family transporter [Terrarubrum flagellatum]|uniref:AEC family transporter n=1 Tax=Terrirubrum flagellatum TaxID=2895980 RepID=UPI0031454F54